MSTMMQWILVHPYTISKKWVFNLEINISTVLATRMSSGKLFHVLTVAMLNARSPYVMSFVSFLLNLLPNNLLFSTELTS